MRVAGVLGVVGAVVVDSYTGSCLCGELTYLAQGLSDIWYCHCRQCQKLTGLYVAAAGVRRTDLQIYGQVDWKPISEKSRSGHCPKCGAYLFWDHSSRDTISVMAGSLDRSEGLDVKGHIFVEAKADFVDITDGLPQYPNYPPGGTRA